MLLADSIRADADGTAFAIGDGRNFQTIVVRFGDTEATFFPDVPMAVADDLVVTSQTVGRSAELGLFDADGERRASIASEERPIGGLIDGDRFVFVSETRRDLRCHVRRRCAPPARRDRAAQRRRGPIRVAGPRRSPPRRGRQRLPGDRRPRRDDAVPDDVRDRDRNPRRRRRRGGASRSAAAVCSRRSSRSPVATPSPTCKAPT